MQYLFHNIQEILYINLRNRINILESLELIVYMRILFNKPKNLTLIDNRLIYLTFII